MTDARVTNRLLEVIQESASEILLGCEDAAKEAGLILEAVREMSRRGDTLVLQRDLEIVLAMTRQRSPFFFSPEQIEALSQVEKKICG